MQITDEVNAGKVRCYGPGIEAKGTRKGQAAPFTVDASKAGSAPLDVITTDANGSFRGFFGVFGGFAGFFGVFGGFAGFSGCLVALGDFWSYLGGLG